MGLLAVIAAAAGSWIFGAIWYMGLSKSWLEASGVPLGPDGKPAGGMNPTPFLLSAICMLLVAGMMRHIFHGSAIVTPGAGLLAGLGVGAFFIAPWIMINNAYAMRPFRLTLIDGGYAIIGCAIIGTLLTLL